MRHRYECPTRWADIDQLGHVNNVVFVDYLQEARVDFVRALFPERGGSHDGGVSHTGEGLVVVRHEITYLSPMGPTSTPVSVECWVQEIKGASLTLGYEVFREDADDGSRRVHVRARTVLAPFLFAEGRPRRLRPEERAMLHSRMEVDEDAVRYVAIPAVDRQTGRHWPLPVRFSDLDVYGHVNNVRHLEYFQEARVRMMRELVREAGVDLPTVVVAQTDVEYRRPVLLRPTPYDTRTAIARVGTRSMTVVSEILAEDDVLSRSRVTLVFFDRETQRSAAPPPDLLERLAQA